MPRAVTRYGIPALLLLGLVTIVYVLASAAGWGGLQSNVKSLAVGDMEKLIVLDPAPVQPVGSFADIDGNPVSLADFRGKVVVVNLWATWCPPCVEEMPTLAALQTARGGEDFVVLAVSVDQVADRDFAISELRKLSGGVLNFYHDPNYVLPYSTQAAGFPTTIIYDRTGEEVGRIEGDADWGGEDALRLVDWALGR